MAEETILGSDNASAVETKEESLLTGGDEEKKEDTDVVKKTAEGEEKKDDDGAAAEDKDSKADTSEGAPETYADFSLPEGMEVNKDALAEASGLFKEFNLTQEQAQKLVDFEAKTKAGEMEKSQEAWSNAMQEWRKAAKSDSEIGGEAFTANVAVAKGAIKAFGNEKFSEMLEITGASDHPEMVRFLFKVGNAIKDDSILQGSNTSSAEKSQANKLFPDMN